MSRRVGWALGGTLVVAALLRGVGLGELALIGDESYYWLWSRHLDWAYYDHPAGVALLVRLSTTLGGQGEAGVRWLNALLGVGCVFLTYQVGRRMLSRQAGIFAALMVAVGAPYLITSRFVYTDALHLFLMLLNLYWFWRLLEKSVPSPRMLIAFGVSLALLFNTKYSAYLYAAALAVAVLIDHRRLLVECKFWAGVLIGTLGLVPVVAWNATHGWASFRWQLSHVAVNVAGRYSLLGNLRHGLVYLTWPLAVLALAGLGCVRRPAERLLSLVAFFLILPVALSPANSPRNLSSGLVLLLLLAGTRLPPTLNRRRHRLTAALLAAGVLATAVYGVGTVASLSGPSPWPHSSIVPAILRDGAGWRDLGPDLAAHPAPVFALDYSLAAQIRYYTGQPAYTSWGQYRIWGVPYFHDATIVSLDYLPEELVSARLRDAFQHVEGPQRLWYAERGVVKEVRVWQVEGLQLDQGTFLQTFDFLTLLEAGR
ncbi:MAG: glycosyltransferase family 39 protein [Anaerolineae bacterium]